MRHEERRHHGREVACDVDAEDDGEHHQDFLDDATAKATEATVGDGD